MQAVAATAARKARWLVLPTVCVSRAAPWRVAAASSGRASRDAEGKPSHARDGDDVARGYPPVNPEAHAKSPDLVAKMGSLEGAVSEQTIKPAQAALEAYARAQQHRLSLEEAMHAHAPPRPSGAVGALTAGGDDDAESPSNALIPAAQANPEDQLVLVSESHNTELIYAHELKALFELHRKEPAKYTTDVLSLEFGLPLVVVENLLKSCALPLVVRADNDLYGVWDVVSLNDESEGEESARGP